MAGLLASRATTADDLARYEAEAEWFARRSLQYRNVFDAERGFFVGRDPDGSWRVGTEFDPRDWGDDYTETNAYGTAFTAPHDPAGVSTCTAAPSASTRRSTGSSRPRRPARPCTRGPTASRSTR